MYTILYLTFIVKTVIYIYIYTQLLAPKLTHNHKWCEVSWDRVCLVTLFHIIKK